MTSALPSLAVVQECLVQFGLDGWLLYDFRGSNPLFARLLGSDVSGRLVTRRRFLWIPRQGDPALLVHAIEAQSHRWPWSMSSYADRQSLVSKLAAIVAPARRVAVEYSPGCALPYASYVDGGTLDLLRSLGLELLSSENIAQVALARWDADALASHQEAARLLDRTLLDAFASISRSVRGGVAATEYDVQRFMLDRFRERGLVTDHPPDVAVNANSANPHYSPEPGRSPPIGEGDWLLIDLWARLDRPGSVYADTTWVAVLSAACSARQQEIFSIVRAARERGLDVLRQQSSSGRVLAGWEVDRAVRAVIVDAGYGDAFTHRTGHSLSPEALHGDGVCLDDYETHDTRLLITGVGVTIEPGIYLHDFGVRSEIDVYIGASGPEVYTGVQDAVVCLLS